MPGVPPARVTSIASATSGFTRKAAGPPNANLLLNRGYRMNIRLDVHVFEAFHHLYEDGDASPIVDRLACKEPAAVEQLGRALESHVIADPYA
jgi:hypothetical protein